MLMGVRECRWGGDKRGRREEHRPLPYSDEALKVAGRLANEQKARLTICHAVNPTLAYETPAFAPEFVDTYLTGMRKEAQELVTRAAAQASADGKLETHVLEGNAIEEIVRLADSLKCDLIVVGSHGRTGLTRLLLGSVAEGVARLAHAPVLIVRPS